MNTTRDADEQTRKIVDCVSEIFEPHLNKRLMDPSNHEEVFRKYGQALLDQCFPQHAGRTVYHVLKMTYGENTFDVLSLIEPVPSGTNEGTLNFFELGSEGETWTLGIVS